MEPEACRIAVTVRTAGTEDAGYLPAVERSAGEIFRSIPELAWIADDTIMSVEEHLQAVLAGMSWVAVENDGNIVGFLSAEGVEGDLHICELAVRLDRQRKGIGRRLVEAAEAHARAAGLRRMTLSTFRNVGWNEDFYVGVGFVTMDASHLDERLREVVRQEAGKGIPVERRCIMQRVLR